MMNDRNTLFIAWRFYLILTVISLVVIGLAWRVFDLAVLDQPFLQKEGDERVLRLVSTPDFRGMITDRNGYPLAVSTNVFSAWMNPQEINLSPSELQQLADTLHIKPATLSALIKRYKKTKREFVYLQRALPPEISDRIKTLHFAGIYLQTEDRRYYPEGEATAHLVGITNIDDNGQEGLELGYNDWLRGEQGKKWVIKDRLGRVIADVQNIQSQKAGNNLTLSIDRRIQYLAYRELLAGVKENIAESGSVVVLDVNTGEILAMVNVPSFNPNNRIRNKNSVRNRAVTDTFEPGSTMKAFTIASALEAKKITPDTMIDTSPGWMRVDHNVVKDHQNNGVLSVTQILQMSSNVGAAKIVLTLPPNQLWNLLHRVGFGEITGIGFPGEQGGVLEKRDAFTLATLSFGYSLSVTTLQLAAAFSVFAHHGIKIPVSLLRLNSPPKGERVLDAKISDTMLDLMKSVLAKGGTAADARVAGYQVAGKTGTAKKVGRTGYAKHQYTSSFVGIAPLTAPRLVIAVVIHVPKGKYYYGGQVAGPIFAKIMEGTLRILAVPPDAETA